MNTGRSRGLAATLTLALGAGTVAGAALLGSPAWAAGTGTYSLDTTAIAPGQQVTLTQTAFEDSTPDTAATVTVNWGDGSSSTLEGGSTSVQHAYSASGTFTVGVTIADDGASTDGTLTDAVVKVAATTFKFNPTWNWTWTAGGHEAKLELAGIPSNTTRVWVNWGDGETSLVNKANTSVQHYYTWGSTGAHSATVTLESPQGKVTKPAGTYTLKADTTAPSATLTIPGSPSKASSWKTIQGTAKDGQSGLDVVGVQLFKWNSTTDWYYNFSTNKWVKYNWNNPNIPQAAVKYVKADSAGKWKVSGVAGLAKGYHLEVDYFSYDKAGNGSERKYKVQNLTS
ncbi:PKD domain-containing protein [Actinoplanes sp. NPDC049681]|uniref:PKD domain-containing protein n=1 Tax=Actinoplanes sp. NPDC049681 TaxID=3363905 RepID=UPI0037A47398